MEISYVILVTMSFKYVLQQYINNPKKFPDSVVLEEEDFLVIRDAYPKSVRHLLVIPRSSEITHIHPLDVFDKNQDLYNRVSQIIKKAENILVDELLDIGLLKFESDDAIARELFINTFVRAGIHSVPSLANLHIHVISKDFFSPRLKNKKHYNSFTTSFFVDFDELDPSKRSSASEKTQKNPIQIIKDSPLRCTYCGKSFENKFKHLKLHLEKEFINKFKPSASQIQSFKRLL